MSLLLMTAMALSIALQTHALPIAKQEQAPDQELVILIHGLMRTSMSMIPLKRHLTNYGYQTYLYSYPSPKYDIREHGLFLQQFIKQLLVKNPRLKIHFITHSLGGIITREAIAHLNQQQLKHIGYLIMLAPPNQGSVLAKWFIKILPPISSTIKPMAELSSDRSSYIHQVPIPKIKMAIIAGRYDAKVPPSSAQLQDKIEFAVVNSTHSFIMNNSDTKKLIIHFLAKGSFNG